jgi:hypothetical protein
MAHNEPIYFRYALATLGKYPPSREGRRASSAESMEPGRFHERESCVPSGIVVRPLGRRLTRLVAGLRAGLVLPRAGDLRL